MVLHVNLSLDQGIDWEFLCMLGFSRGPKMHWCVALGPLGTYSDYMGE